MKSSLEFVWRKMPVLLSAAALAGLLAGGFAVSAAGAFEQTTGPASASKTLPALPGIEISPQSSPRGAGLELTGPDPLGANSADSKSTGVGLGFGLLPKLDFGLELLYGSSDQGSPNTDEINTLPDSLTVHGEVKKTF